MAAGIGVRWTIGDPDPRGFEALALSIRGAVKLFGPAASYAVCVNGMAVDEARRRTGPCPGEVSWRPSGTVPASIARNLGAGMAEGVAWKLAPLRLFPDRYEISLDNDCILWEMPGAMRAWLDEAAPCCLIAGDVEAAHGAFADLTRPEPRNTGIRGLPPGFDLERALARVLVLKDVPLSSELDEQGLQVAALDLDRPAHVISTEDVSICSPFHPRKPRLGRCGAHFVGLNVRSTGWDHFGRPGEAWIEENWRRHRPALERLTAAEGPAPGG